MRPFVFIAILFTTLFASALQVSGQVQTNIQIGLSSDVVEITSSFDGTSTVIFGSIENGNRELLKEGRYDVVVILIGPKVRTIVRRRERKFGIWLNGSSLSFADVPSSYSVATTRPLNDIAQSSEIKMLEIGLDNLNGVSVTSGFMFKKTETFRKSLQRLKVKQNLYLENIGGIEFLSPTLFKAKLTVPANVPIGKHTARAFLFRDGKFISSKFTEMRVKKIGFEQYTYDLANRNGLLYGIIAVLVAIATGWIASLVFRKD
ncbi:MAG: TIGR02186 family protein [Rhizobiaceae bacterium]